MSNRILLQTSHVLVHTSSREIAASLKIYAVIQICFGSDDDFIGQILYAGNGDGRVGYILPSRESVYVDSKLPVFGGRLEQEIRDMARTALERIKKAKGAISHGKKYRVTRESVQEEQQEEKTSVSVPTAQSL